MKRELIDASQLELEETVVSMSIPIFPLLLTALAPVPVPWLAALGYTGCEYRFPLKSG